MIDVEKQLKCPNQNIVCGSFPSNHSSTTTHSKFVYAPPLKLICSHTALQMDPVLSLIHGKVYAGSDLPLTILVFPSVHPTDKLPPSHAINITMRAPTHIPNLGHPDAIRSSTVAVVLLSLTTELIHSQVIRYPITRP